MIKNILIAIVPFLFCFCSPQKSEEVQKPNILIILADDLGYSDIGCFGGEIETPNLDKLAENGIRFTRFYNTARCCPSRASLLTGLHPHQTGLGEMVDFPTKQPGYQGEINDSCVTLASVLRPEGYKTYMCGKWHVAHSWDGSDKHNWPLQRGFDRYFGTIFGAGSYFDPRMIVVQNETFTNTPSDFYYTDAIADSTVGFLKDHFRENPDKPFFMYAAFTAPHWPLHAKEKDIDKYRGRYDAGWEELREERIQKMINMGLIDPDWTMNYPTGISDWSDVKNKDEELRRMEVYAAMVNCLDQGIGRITDYLREEGRLENTLIIFLSDNGACAESWGGDNPWAARFGPEKTRDGIIIDYSNDGSRDPGPADTYYSYGRNWAHLSNTPYSGYKSGTREGGIATPFIVHWPKGIKEKGVYRNQLAGIIDIMPTLLELSHAEYPLNFNDIPIIPYEGKSLVNAIVSNEPIERSEYFVEHIGNRGFIEDDTLKLIKFGKNPWELYNLKTDRTETNNIAEKYPEKTLKMADKWEAWALQAHVLPKP